MLEVSRFSIIRHIENFFSKKKVDLWHKRQEISPGYFAFTRRFDRIVDGTDLASVLGESSRDADDAFLSAVSGFRNSLNMLRKQEVAKIKRSSEFLKTAIDNAVSPKVIVTFLVDHSGSLRGEGIQLTALFSAFVGKILTQANIDVEVLGFTTSFWEGGKSREFWVELGAPPMPGRLNDLLHVIHRSAELSDPWADDCVETMLTPNLLKENIDGEALLWAEERLLRHAVALRILVVVSDGAPVDDSTLVRNTLPDGSYPILADHLTSQIRRVRSEDMIKLTAVGINYRVQEYYGSKITFQNIVGLPKAAYQLLSFIIDSVQSTVNQSK
jgi:cobaltochelatase CobT